ncbi:uncharacterized protein LACBIDRAFT_298820 [Laccaria bicolor S238N-H82]|uniref:Predicted protein n=1 Tax=Laccaria bicolor (strain S238N-H82 / ATCC MYA-4686) TaxID=486041 RepID=B0E3I0_LACBS|nr:uncharacterized protein LACBIDRAFT_298820 [Laccaria bicolor S238N-H82]EDQ98603.1 predicted protein [Laccaria bicolor S238N-H82]|eukprot:XP_001890750.1 predicted protein [Laccaria bicolor S238N-H82]
MKPFTKRSTSHQVPSCGPFHMGVDSIQYLCTPQTCSTKPFTKWLSSHPVHSCGLFHQSMGSFAQVVRTLIVVPSM